MPTEGFSEHNVIHGPLPRSKSMIIVGSPGPIRKLATKRINFNFTRQGESLSSPN
jgi:hypothetical protein